LPQRSVKCCQTPFAFIFSERIFRDMITILSETQGIHQLYIRELRDQAIQKDRMRFRLNLRRLAVALGHRLSETLVYEACEVTTPLGTASGWELKDQPVLATILRAGMPMHDGMLEVFDGADNAFVSAYRRYLPGGEFEIEVDYMSAPDLTGRTVILTDPMLATGASMACVWEALLKNGEPEQLHVVSTVASREGMAAVQKSLPSSTHYWVGALDDETTARGYIVPGLGDAGDLAYGSKKS
jgi:uracil phosphoribosyltransferase